MKRLFASTAAVTLCCAFAAGQQYRVLYNFEGPPNDGVNAMGSLTMDSAGNLYGETQGGGSGASFGGTVFELSPGSAGVWTETILYNFCSDYVDQVCLDGTLVGGGLTLDSDGNLYGTTEYGGANSAGLLFQLSPPLVPGAAWTYSVLYSFCSDFVNNQCLDGAYPNDRPIFDSVGNLYGTGGGGTGHGPAGVVWELSPSAGQWTEATLYNFCTLGQGNYCFDGSDPLTGVTFDKLGNLFGTTGMGGRSGDRGDGVLFELSPSSSGWTETVLFKFRPAIGVDAGGVVLDRLGNVYGTLYQGGQNDNGAVFKWGANGGSAEFQFNRTDGEGPVGGLLLDLHRHALFGATDSGGNSQGLGTVFEITPPAKETVLYNFCSQSDCTDGRLPGGGVIEDAAGNLYGTTRAGGAGGLNGYGVIYEIVR